MNTLKIENLPLASLKPRTNNPRTHSKRQVHQIAQSIEHFGFTNPILIDDENGVIAGHGRLLAAEQLGLQFVPTVIQFVKSMRLNNAAMKIAGGMTVNEAAMDVGYVSPSQFSREFKRMYGQSPRQWSDAHQLPVGAA